MPQPQWKTAHFWCMLAAIIAGILVETPILGTFLPAGPRLERAHAAIMGVALLLGTYGYTAGSRWVPPSAQGLQPLALPPPPPPTQNTPPGTT